MGKGGMERGGGGDGSGDGGGLEGRDERRSRGAVGKEAGCAR